MYLAYQADSPRESLATTIAAARAAYAARFHAPATLVLLPDDAEAPSVAGCTVEPGRARGLVVGRGCVYVGEAS